MNTALYHYYKVFAFAMMIDFVKLLINLMSHFNR